MNVREKLVELMGTNTCKHDYCEDCEYREDENACVAYLKDSMADHIISSGVTVQEWISAKDRLPEKKGAFLVYVKTKNKWCGYIKTTWFTPCYEGVEDHMQGKQVWYDYDSDWGDYEVRDVTHWMPLPQPPKGE